VSDAEQAIEKATSDVPADVAGRLTSADKLSDADRNAILEVATRALAPFQPTSKPKPVESPTSEPKPVAKASP
jgi:F-type H+-transporting ATPase subunit alpha